jgi:hypothetical protein
MPRKVAIQRIKGLEHPHVPVGKVYQGWELDPPMVGSRYCLFKESGAVFRSSPVLEIIGKAFRTRHSLYTLRVLEEMAELPQTDLERSLGALGPT